jgi:hypothetical protein
LVADTGLASEDNIELAREKYGEAVFGSNGHSYKSKGKSKINP